jgi:prevent-host-death family protein
MGITASALRANVYRLLDEVLDSQEPLEVTRRGQTLLIVPKAATPRLDRLQRRDDFIAGDPSDLVSLDWSSEWRP